VSEYDIDVNYPCQTFVDYRGVVQMTNWALSWYDKYPATLAGKCAEIKRMYKRGAGKLRIQIAGTVSVMEMFQDFSEHGWVSVSFVDVNKDRDDPQFTSSLEYIE
jgi:hypothetical protein